MVSMQSIKNGSRTSLSNATLAQVINNRFITGNFPVEWKVGRLVTISKAPDRNPADLKSIRPLTLLHEIVKCWEPYSNLSYTIKINMTFLNRENEFIELIELDNGIT